MCNTNYNFAQQGWQCPICKRVYSPTTAMCFYCGGETKSTTTTGPVTVTGPITVPKDYPGAIDLEYPNVIKAVYDSNNINKDVKSVDC